MSDKTNLFEVASRNKFRFPSDRGDLTTEQLWDISLKTLNEVAVNIYNELEKSGKINFITETTSANKELTQKLDLIKQIIAIRKEIAQAKANSLQNAEMRKALREQIAAHKNAALLTGTVEELEARLAQLESEN